MSALFQNVMQASIHGSIIIGVVLALRLVLRRTPKKFVCLLWLLAFARLLMPFEIQSSFSLQPDVEQFSERYIQEVQTEPAETPAMMPAVPETAELPEDVGVTYGDAFSVPEAEPLPDAYQKLYAEHVSEEIHVEIDWNAVFAWVWGVAVCVFGLYSLISYLGLKHQVREAVKIPGGWECDRIETAFILGFLRPRIYIPMNLPKGVQEHILSHEHAHLDRGDHWMKLLGYIALALHWFNPLVWVAYILLCKDIEMACDERVVQFMGLDQRKSYSAALLRCSTRKTHYAACPVAFGEVSVKERIKSVLNYRKPGFWISLVGILAIVFVAVFLMTNPGEEEPDSSFLNYENAVPLAEAQSSVTAVYYEDSTIYPCEIVGEALAEYLDSVSWTERWLEPRDTSSPGSVVFNIAEGYRICIFDRNFARVKYDGEERYYRIGWGDYEKAKALVTEHSGETVIDGEAEEEVRNMIERCGNELERWQSYDSYYLFTEDQNLADSMQDGIQAEFWVSGDTWLRTTTFPETVDVGAVWSWLEVDGARYEQYLCGPDYDGEAAGFSWRQTDKTDDMFACAWPMIFSWEDCSVAYKESGVEDGKETITLTVTDNVSAYSESSPYDAKFCFAESGELESIALTMYKHFPNTSLPTLIVTFRLGSTEKTEIEKVIGEAYAACIVSEGEANTGTEREIVTPSNETSYDKDFGLGSEEVFWNFFNESWAYYLGAQDATAGGLTLRHTHYGYPGNYGLYTGSEFWLEEFVDGKWALVADPAEKTWDDAVHTIFENREYAYGEITYLKVDWKEIYGELKPGYYRIGRHYTATSPAGTESTNVCYAKFRVYNPNADELLNKCRSACDALLASDSYHIYTFDWMNELDYEYYLSHEVLKHGEDFLSVTRYPLREDTTKMKDVRSAMWRDGKYYGFGWSGEPMASDITECWTGVDGYLDGSNFDIWTFSFEWYDAQVEDIFEEGNTIRIIETYDFDDKYECTEMTFVFDENGNLRGMVNACLPTRNCAEKDKIIENEMVVFDTSASEIAGIIGGLDVSKPIPFTYDDSVKDKGNAQTSGFQNTTASAVRTPEDAIALADRECTLPVRNTDIAKPYYQTKVFYDPDAKMWKVELYWWQDNNCYQAIYMNDQGITQVIVTGNW